GLQCSCKPYLTLSCDANEVYHTKGLWGLARTELTSHGGSVTEPRQTREELLDSSRMAMRPVPATVHAGTTRRGGGPSGFLATAVSSLSFDPPSLLVCVNRQASLHAPLANAEVFCVNVLGLSNRDVAERFMVGGADRFDVGEWVERHGVPVLATAQSSFIC